MAAAAAGDKAEPRAVQVAAEAQGPPGGRLELAVLPVPRSVLHTHASPRSAVNFLMHAAGLSGEQISPRRCLTMPGVAVTVGEQIEALERIAGRDVAALVRDEPDETVWAIVKNWPTRFEAKRARDLGFQAETSFDEIVRIHIEEELGGSA